MGRFKIQIPKEKLVSLYWGKFLSPPRISKLYECDAVTIRTRMREHGIPFRSSSGARMRYRKFDFSGDLIEKAYLIGFRLGDLNIWQTSVKSELIIARCNTTQSVQVKLMRKLFSRYGKVTVSLGPYSMNVQCYLNTSFNFLIPKDGVVPMWIGDNTATAAAFIAGYTDAEGNFILNQKKGRFKIDSYDVGVLTWMTDWLRKQGILVRLRCIAKSGELRTDGSKFNNDLWRLNINEAPSLLRFINLIKPHLQHKTRLKNMIVCEKNIWNRIENGTVKYGQT